MKITKKLFTLTMAILFVLSFTSCESTKNAASTTTNNDIVQTENEIYTQEAADADIVETDEIISEIETDENESEADVYEEKSNNTSIQKKQEKKPLISFGNVDKFILTDSISLFEPNAFGVLNQKMCTITIDPKEGLAGFGGPYLLAYYIITMDEQNRKLFSQAVTSYLNDFSAKKLDRKNNKAFKKYGNVATKIYWGSIKTSTPNNSFPKAFLGYEFYNNSPYFTITIYATINNYLEINSNADKECMNLKYYFTKAQATALVNYLSNDYLSPIFSEYDLFTVGVPMEADNY